MCEVLDNLPHDRQVFGLLMVIWAAVSAAIPHCTSLCPDCAPSHYVRPPTCRVWRDMGSSEWQQTLVAESDRYEDLGQW